MTRAGHRNRYKPGDWLADCDVCGFTYYASELRKRWDGFMVCSSDYEERHPQDLLRIPRSERPIPWARPPQNNYVTGMNYQLADGYFNADGSIVADGGAGTPTDNAAIYVVFGPVDPDSL